MNLKTTKIKEEKKREEQQKEIQKELDTCNQQRKYLRKYLVCTHILQTGLLKWVYYFYSQNLKKKKRKKNFRILLNTERIKWLKDEFKVEDLYTKKLIEFKEEYEKVEERIKKFNWKSETKSQFISSISNIDEVMSDDSKV